MKKDTIDDALTRLERLVADMRRDTLRDMMAASADAAIRLRAMAVGVLLLAVLATGCTSLRPMVTVDNPRLQEEGVIAVKGNQLTDAIRASQRSLEPMVDTQVLTATEALNVSQIFATALETSQRMIGFVQFADLARTQVERVAALKRVGANWRDLLRQLTSAAVPVASDVGRAAIAGLTGTVTDALGDLVPVLGGVK